MICIFAGEAIKRLQAANAPLHVKENGLVTISENKGFKRIREFNYIDSLGSLVSRDAIGAEIEYWWNNRKN